MRLLPILALCLLPGCVPDGPAPGKERQTAKRAQQAEKKRRTPKAKTPRGAPAASARALPPIRDPQLTGAFEDDFEREHLGGNWRATSSAWSIDEGRLCGERARNHPVWLRRSLPVNARIEFDATSSSPDGDLKAELWGDGRTYARGATYDHASSYLVIFGGWKNQFHVLARMDEHGKDRQEIRLLPQSDDPKRRKVEPDRTYHFVVERSDDKTLRWSVDGQELLTFTDPEPLSGPGHDHFGFNDWDVRVCFDNLNITPLPD